MEIQQLRHLLAAIHHGNLGRAAHDMNISQSGLSRSIKSLETRFGVPLLVRRTKGVEPTPFGLSVAHRAEIILNEVGRATKEVNDLRAARTGEVVLGVTQNYAHHLVPKVLASLYEVAPDVRITVLTGGFMELLEQLRSGSLDLAFGLLGTIEETDEITISSLKEHRSHVIANARHPLAGVKPSAADLAQARWVTLISDGFQRPFAYFFQQRSLPLPAQIFRTDSIDIIRQLLLEVEALSVLPADVVRMLLDAGELVTLDCDTPAERTRVGLIYRTDSYVTPQMRLVINHLKAAA